MTKPSATGIDWEAALRHHQPWLRKVLRCRIDDPHAVDDLFQEIALAVCRQASRPVEPKLIAPWLYRLAVRQAINFYRRRGRKTRVELSSDLDGVSSAPDPLDWLLAAERRNAVRAGLNELRPQDREILILKYTENWDYNQLAQHLGVRVKTIEYRLMRARQRLRERLARSEHVANPESASKTKPLFAW